MVDGPQHPDSASSMNKILFIYCAPNPTHQHRMPVRMQNCCSLLVRMKSNSATLEDNLADSHKITCIVATWPSSHASRCSLKSVQIPVYKCLHMDAYIQNHSNWEQQRFPLVNEQKKYGAIIKYYSPLKRNELSSSTWALWAHILINKRIQSIKVTYCIINCKYIVLWKGQ